MKILVTGCGRSCTNWISEIVKATKKFNWVGIPEDRNLFNRLHLPDRYATKLAVEHPSFTESNLKALGEINPDLRILWSVKHPVANVMAKIYRGRPASEGGDKVTENISVDGFIETAILAVRKSFDLIQNVPVDTMIVKLEELINKKRLIIDSMGAFMKMHPTKIRIDAFEKTPNRYQLARYGKSVDKSQAEIYNNWETAYDGYFADKKDLIEKAKEELQDVAEFFKYEL